MTVAKKELTDRQREVLHSLDWEAWLRPMDVGGRNASHHSSTLKSLVRRGLVEERQRGGYIRRPMEYRRVHANK